MTSFARQAARWTLIVLATPLALMGALGMAMFMVAADLGGSET